MVRSSTDLGDDATSLRTLDLYRHRVVARATSPEEVGPFTLFRPTGPHAGFARPRPDAVAPTGADLRALDARCRALGLPLALEWITVCAPTLADRCREHGLRTRTRPLLAQTPAHPATARPLDRDPGGTSVVLDAWSDLVRAALATASVAFGAPDHAIGPGDVEDRRLLEGGLTSARVDAVRARIAVGDTVLAAGLAQVPVAIGADNGRTTTRPQVVATAQYQADGTTAEIVGVATLPAHRRRGWALHLVQRLVHHAHAHHISLVAITAEDDRVGRIYERTGFHRLAESGQAVR